MSKRLTSMAVLFIFIFSHPNLSHALSGYYSSPTTDPITNTTEYYAGSEAHYPHHGYYNWLIRAGLIMATSATGCIYVGVGHHFLQKTDNVARKVTRYTGYLAVPFQFSGLVMAESSTQGVKLKVIPAAKVARPIGLSRSEYLAWNDYLDQIEAARQTLVEELDSMGEEVSDEVRIQYASQYWPSAFRDFKPVGIKSPEEAEAAFNIVTQHLAFESGVNQQCKLQ